MTTKFNVFIDGILEQEKKKKKKDLLPVKTLKKWINSKYYLIIIIIGSLTVTNGAYYWKILVTGKK